MIWLRRLLGLCQHKYSVIRTNDVYETPTSSRPFKTKYVLQCQHCGIIKVKSF